MRQDDQHVCFGQQYAMFKIHHEIDGLVQDCSNSSALPMELLLSCTKPSELRYP